MTTTLSEGVKVPDVGSVNWAGDLEVNWNLLNGALANLSGNVKLDRDNTWTGEQSFTLPIVGSITGTAAKAIADEDGTSIKTGYVNVAGDQTVSGQKTWRGTQIWQSALYVYNSDSIASTPQLNLRNSKVTKGTTTDSGSQIIQYLDKDNKFLSQITTTKATTGTTQLSFVLGNLDSNSNSLVSSLVYSLATDGTKQFIPGTNSTHSLGSSSYQWKSVYAQSYYYNGTQWGLNQDNTWTGRNAFLAGSYNNHTVLANATLDLSNGNPALSETNQGMILFTDKDKWLGKMYARLQSWTATDQTVTVLGATYRPDANTENDFSVWLSNTSNLKSFHPYGVSEPHLGNAAHKWKTLNGINPGALSFPNGNAQDTSWIGDLIIKDGSDYNLKTFTLNGWITINIPNTAGNLVVVNNGCGQIITNEAKGVTGGNCAVFIPVVANVQVSILLVLQTGESVKTAIFTPCLGNV